MTSSVSFEKPRKYSVKIRGHATSFTLEPCFMHALRQWTDSQGLSLNQGIEFIDNIRQKNNLSSAIRQFLWQKNLHR